MSNVKPGDLAVIVSNYPGAGATCTVGQQATGHVRVMTSNGLWQGTLRPTLHWWCEFPRQTIWATKRDGSHVTTVFCPIADQYLRKLAGPDVPVETTEEEWLDDYPPVKEPNHAS
jgi:hypothetical protein